MSRARSGTTACAMATNFLLLILAMATSTISCLQQKELEALVHMAQTQVLLSKNFWVQASWKNHVIGGSFSDCIRLYDESESLLARLLISDDESQYYTQDDARTWLSGVMANHRSCLDGLMGHDHGIGFVDETDHHHDHLVAENLTTLLSEALAKLYVSDIISTGRTSGNYSRDQKAYQNGGILTSWNPSTSRANFIVSKDGSGTHRTINAAVAALSRMGRKRPERVIIYEKSGIYNEKVEIGWDMKNVMLVGDGIDKTIVTGKRNVVDGSSTTLNSATFGVSGDGFWARDITFENTAGPSKHQAVALSVSSDRSVFYRCSFKGYQDTLCVHSLRQFYRDCQICGTIDFIFGDASAVFQNCDIFVRRPMRNQANMITAQGRVDPNENTGIVIQGSRVRSASDLGAVKTTFRTFLGRPWKKYSRTVFMKTDLDGLLDPEGWTEWSGNFALSTLFYGEYMNTGIGAHTQRRVKWPGFHVLKSPMEASPFAASTFIQAESWIQVTGVPIWLGI